MKKIVLLTLMVFFGMPSLVLANDRIKISFLNGDVIEHTADSYWTKYNKHNSYYEYYEKDHYGDHDTVYVCISDYVEMNPVSRETKKGDFRTLRDQAKALGHYCHYFDRQHTFTDQYGVSFRYQDIKYIEINGKGAY